MLSAGKLGTGSVAALIEVQAGIAVGHVECVYVVFVSLIAEGCIAVLLYYFAVAVGG